MHALKSSTFLNLYLKMYFQKQEKDCPKQGLVSIAVAVLTEYCVLPKTFHLKGIETSFIIFLFQLTLTCLAD